MRLVPRRPAGTKPLPDETMSCKPLSKQKPRAYQTSMASMWRGIPQLHQLPGLPQAGHGTHRLTPATGIPTLAPMVTVCLLTQSFRISLMAVPSVAAVGGTHPIMDISSSPPALIPWSFPLSVAATQIRPVR